MKILSINAGSSSLKFTLFDMKDETAIQYYGSRKLIINVRSDGNLNRYYSAVLINYAPVRSDFDIVVGRSETDNKVYIWGKYTGTAECWAGMFARLIYCKKQDGTTYNRVNLTGFKGAFNTWDPINTTDGYTEVSTTRYTYPNIVLNTLGNDANTLYII